MSSLAPRVEASARAAGLFPKQGRAIVAVSGGPDSVALLDLFAAGGLAERFGLVLVVAHVDHGIAPNSVEVADRVRQLVQRLGIDLMARRLDLGRDASESVAREERYAALRAMQAASGAHYLLTAHHRDDQVETILLRVLRGSGPAGLAGIPSRGPQGLVRPLLPFARAEIAAYLGERGITPPCPADPGNVATRHDRTWIRHDLLPRLRARFGPETDGGLERLAHAAADDRRAWRQLLRALPELGFRRSTAGVEVDRTVLASYAPDLAQAILRALGREIGLRLGGARSARLLRFAADAASGRRVALGGGVEARADFDVLRLVPLQTAEVPEEVTLALDRDGRSTWGPWVFAWTPARASSTARAGPVAWFPPGEVRVRALAPGDRIRPLNGVGHRKVRRLLAEARVPTADRGRYPVVERNGAIVWVPGVCRGADAVPVGGSQAVRMEVLRSDDESGR
jgi:tRNA(Ile)-lysidine synthase